mmetsp:Transcript_2808/g.4837  ORF Transcript_2808/g.4837 Transcript_2808/m.4837 type:complete len:257 (+) Transcript_2808:305-1075(+)
MVEVETNLQRKTVTGTTTTTTKNHRRPPIQRPPPFIVTWPRCDRCSCRITRRVRLTLTIPKRPRANSNRPRGGCCNCPCIPPRLVNCRDDPMSLKLPIPSTPTCLNPSCTNHSRGVSDMLSWRKKKTSHQHPPFHHHHPMKTTRCTTSLDVSCTLPIIDAWPMVDSSCSYMPWNDSSRPSPYNNYRTGSFMRKCCQTWKKSILNWSSMPTFGKTFFNRHGPWPFKNRSDTIRTNTILIIPFLLRRLRRLPLLQQQI